MPAPADLSLPRLMALRAGYLLVVVGLGAVVWPGIIQRAPTWDLMHGVEACMLGAFSVLAAVGLLRPLGMLPILLWELAWKTLWLTAVALPRWLSHTLDPAMAETAGECLMAVVFVVIIPWPYVVRTYVLAPAETWGRRARPDLAADRT